MDENKSVKSKIVKLFALAGNNPSQEEAQAALLKAQELMAQHNLTMSDVQIEEQPTKVIEHGQAMEGEKLGWWKRRLGSIVANNFRCFHYYAWAGRGKHAVTFFGLKEDVEIAKEVFQYASIVIDYSANDFIKHWKKTFLYEKPSRDLTTRTKNDYIVGFLQGLNDKFKEQIDTNGWGLIIVKDALVTEGYEKFRKGNLKTAKASTVSTGGEAGARQRGYKDGRSFDQNTKRVSS